MKKIVLPALLLLCMLAVAVFSESLIYRLSPVEKLFYSDLFKDVKGVEMQFELTAYCPGPCCNTGYVVREGIPVPVDWSDQVAAGDFSLRSLLKAAVRVVAVDSSVIPLGSIVLIEDEFYIALDRGSAIKGKRIDIALHTHEEVEKFGKRQDTSTVYMPSHPSRIIYRLKEMLP